MYSLYTFHTLEAGENVRVCYVPENGLFLSLWVVLRYLLYGTYRSKPL